MRHVITTWHLNADLIFFYVVILFFFWVTILPQNWQSSDFFFWYFYFDKYFSSLTYCIIYLKFSIFLYEGENLMRLICRVDDFVMYVQSSCRQFSIANVSCCHTHIYQSVEFGYGSDIFQHLRNICGKYNTMKSGEPSNNTLIHSLFFE